jgi:hypothetical protein
MLILLALLTLGVWALVLLACLILLGMARIYDLLEQATDGPGEDEDEPPVSVRMPPGSLLVADEGWGRQRN